MEKLMNLQNFIQRLKVKHNRFPKELVYKDISIERKTFTIVMVEEFLYLDSHIGVLRVPVGFDCDLASIPQIFQWLIPKVGIYNGPSILHDYGYCVQRKSRYDYDNMFLRAMKDAGVGVIKRNLIYSMVRMFGWINWMAVKEEELIKYRNLGK